ncbi:MAG TPA: hypothetical protein P5274_00485 [Candidatus Paceibacterota bacterium]|nr:hypothetical protein [Candidatus Paceibacterota bacterium]
MRFFAIILQYLSWHYSRAILEFSHIYKNIIVFVFNFFSISILLRSYFAPWRRMGEDYEKKIIDDFEDVASTFVVNLIMRIVGIVMRTLIIVFGTLFTLLVVLFYPIILISWLVLPLIIVVLVLLGFGLLFK